MTADDSRFMRLTEQSVSEPIVSQSQANRLSADTPQAIIAGAISVMAKDGLPQLTTKRVSERAAVSTGAIHYFFDTKERLIYESFAAVIRNIRRQFAGARQSADPLTRIRATLDVFFSKAQVTGDTVKIWPQLWVHAGTDKATARLFHIYNARMISNFTYDLHAAGMPRAMARSYALRLNALHRGLWIELHLGGCTDAAETRDIYTAMMETIIRDIQTCAKGKAA